MNVTDLIWFDLMFFFTWNFKHNLISKNGVDSLRTNPNISTRGNHKTNFLNKICIAEGQYTQFLPSDDIVARKGFPSKLVRYVEIFWKNKRDHINVCHNYNNTKLSQQKKQTNQKRHALLFVVVDWRVNCFKRSKKRKQRRKTLSP